MYPSSTLSIYHHQNTVMRSILAHVETVRLVKRILEKGRGK